MNVIGKTTINPVLFFSGKIAGYFTWLAFFLAVFNRPIFTIRILASGLFLRYFSFVLCGAGRYF